MNIYEFMTESPILTFFIVSILTQGVVYIFKALLRCFNISKNGWPPEHIDANGEFKDNGEE